MFERYAGSARQAVVAAQEEARSMGHNYIGTEHLLLGLLRGTDDVAARTLAELDVDPEAVRARLVRIVGVGRSGRIDAAALRTVGIDLEVVRRKVEESFGPGALDPRPTGCGSRRRRRRQPASGCGPIPFSPRTKKVLEFTVREAIRLKHDGIGTEHLLLGLLREGRGLAVRLLIEHGVELAEMRGQVITKIRRIA